MSRKLDEFVAKAAKHSAAKRKQHLSGVAQRLRKALLSSSLSDAEVQDKFGLSPSEAKRMLDSFRDAGANIAQHGGRWSIDRHMAPGESDWKMVGKAGKPYRFGLIADTHLGSKHCRLDVCEALYDWFAEQGITTVFHCGNWIEGEARFNKHELEPDAHGMQSQLDYFVEHYPQRDGIKTKFVTGDDHEGWYAQREGVDIGRMLVDTAKRAGRNDLVDLGYKEAFITLEHPKTRKHARLLIDHPGGGGRGRADQQALASEASHDRLREARHRRGVRVRRRVQQLRLEPAPHHRRGARLPWILEDAAGNRGMTVCAASTKGACTGATCPT